jgi:hypothetical protein
MSFSSMHILRWFQSGGECVKAWVIALGNAFCFGRGRCGLFHLAGGEDAYDQQGENGSHGLGV